MRNDLLDHVAELLVKCGPEKDLRQDLEASFADDYIGCRFPRTLTMEEAFAGIARYWMSSELVGPLLALLHLFVWTSKQTPFSFRADPI